MSIANDPSGRTKLLSNDEAAACFAQLGHPARLCAVRLLVQAGPEGLPVGTLQQEIGIPASTLSHHLRHLVSAGIITQSREGRVLRCQLVYRRVSALIDYLSSDCCAGLENFEETSSAA